MKGYVYISGGIPCGGGVSSAHRRPESFASTQWQRLLIVYADRHGERMLTRLPLSVELGGGEARITDGLGREWIALGYCEGDASHPTFTKWSEL